MRASSQLDTPNAARTSSERTAGLLRPPDLFLNRHRHFGAPETHCPGRSSGLRLDEGVIPFTEAPFEIREVL